MVEKKLKIMVVASVLFVVVCSFLVLSSIPLEEYEIKPSQTTVPQGISIKLYSPLIPFDVVKVFNKYTYVHVKYNNSITEYTEIKFSIDANNVTGNNTINFNVSVSKWSLDYSFYINNTTSRYVVSMNNSTGEIENIDYYIDDVVQNYSRNTVEGSLSTVMNRPFILHEYKDIIYFLSLMCIDDTLVSTSNYTRIYSMNITEEFNGEKLRGFRVYIEFPEHIEDTTEWSQHQYLKWTSIYGSYPVNITFNILRLPNSNRWIITYMYVELENGIVHEYFLKDIEFA